jgi:hypothetical protein
MAGDNDAVVTIIRSACVDELYKSTGVTLFIDTGLTKPFDATAKNLFGELGIKLASNDSDPLVRIEPLSRTGRVELLILKTKGGAAKLSVMSTLTNPLYGPNEASRFVPRGTAFLLYESSK